MDASNINYDILGLYYPNYFTININTHANNFFEFSQKEISTYLHEYIHFLQNIVTAYGINDFIYTSHQLANYFSNIDKVNNSFDLYKMYFSMLINNNSKRQEVICHIADNNHSVTCKPKENDKLLEISVDNITRNVKLIYLSCDCKKKLSFYLNGWLIKEGMANLIQYNIFNNFINKAPFYPYKIIPDVSKYILGDILNIKKLLILCDISLSTSTPGYTFVDLCRKIKKGMSIIKLINEPIVFYDIENNKEKFECKYYESCKRIIDSEVFTEVLSTTYSGDIREKIGLYLKELFIKGIKYRKELKPLLFSSFVDIDKTNIMQEIGKLHKQIGMPNVFNIDETRYYGAYADNYFGAPYLSILQRIWTKVYENSDTIPCPLRHECKKIGSKYHSIYKFKICDKNFLLDINEIKEFCLAKSLAYNMGLGYII